MISNRKYYILTILPFIAVATALILSEWSNMDQRIEDMVSQSLDADREEILYLVSNPIFSSYFENIFYDLKPEAQLDLKKIATLFEEKKNIAEKYYRLDPFIALFSIKKMVLAKGSPPNDRSWMDSIIFPEQSGQVTSITEGNIHTTVAPVDINNKPAGYILIQHHIPIKTVTDREVAILKNNLVIIFISLFVLITLVQAYFQYERRGVKIKFDEKEAYYKAIVQGYPGLIYISDENYNIEFMNQNLTSRTGRDGTGEKCYQVLHDLNEPCEWCQSEKVFNGQTVKWEIQSPRDDRWYDVVNSPIHHVDGMISKQSMILDITKRKQAEKKLKESEERYRSMMEAMVEAAYICSPDFRIMYMNSAMINRTGYDAIGDACYKVIHGHDKKCPWCTFDKVRMGESLSHELVSPKDGKTYQISNAPIFHDDGSISKLSIFQDITEFKEMASNLQQVQKIESIGTLAGGIAHDFNNILFPILGYAEMLMEDVPEDNSLKSGINQIYTGALRASELVKQILTFSRQEKGEIKLMKLQPVIKEALQLIRSTIPTTIEIKQKIQNNCGAVKADPTQIHQIIMNLATNAYHAMEKTGGKLNVNLEEIKLDKNDIINLGIKPGTYICLTVKDTGKGMNKKITEKIFDPFFTTKEKGKGTGMGLSVVHGIVKNLDGAIQVYSEPGKGTQFKIYFPEENSFIKDVIFPDNDDKPTGTEHILLVDDEDSIVKMEKKMLERLGYQVTSHTSSIKALDSFRTNPDKFDLVISDMAMPNLSGDKLAVELTRICPEIPILLCTGFSETLSEEKARSLGINGFLWKPIKMKDLSRKVREVLDENIIDGKIMHNR